MTIGGWSDWGNWMNCHVPSSPYLNEFDQIMNYRCGDSDCEGGSGQWQTGAVCLQNAVIRFARAGQSEQFSDVLSACYWRERLGCPEHCYMEDVFDLDVYIGRVTNHQTGHFHAICAQYLGGDVRSTSSWRFFQYNNASIIPGRDWQIPPGVQAEDTKLEILEVTEIPDCGHYEAENYPTAIFMINPQGIPRCIYPP